MRRESATFVSQNGLPVLQSWKLAGRRLLFRGSPLNPFETVGMKICFVHVSCEVLAEAGHVELLFDGDGFKKKTTRFLGGWWIEAAIRGEVASIPVALAKF